MDTSKIIKGVVSNGRYTVTAPIIKEDYGLYLKIEGVELPSTYEVDFSNSENSGTSVTMIGNADGVLIPHQFISTGKDVFAFLYHVGEDFGRTVYKFRIPNKVRPDRTNEEPTPEEQSTIDQCISALNDAVAQTAQDKADADASAQSASADADRAEQARDTAEGFASVASTNASESAQSAVNALTSARMAEDAKTSAQDSAEDAQGYAQASAQSASSSANSASQAQGYAQSASSSAQSASGYASQAQSSAQTASSKASEASQSASTASEKASESAQSASQALSYKTDAESAKTASQTAQGIAEGARDSAISAKNDAESARDEAQRIVETYDGRLTKIDGLVFPQFEFGNIQISSSGWTYANSSLRIRTPQGCTVHLKEGSKISIAEGARFYCGALKSDDTYYDCGAWQTSELTLPVEGDYVILVTYLPQVTVTDIDALASMLTVYSIDNALADVDDKIESLEDDRYKPYPTDTASGAIASFSDGADDLPLKSLIVDINPVQDLSHGDPSPENICPISGWTGMQLNVNGTVIPISWQTEAGTVYGGKLDVLSGVLTVDMAMADLNILNWYNTGTATSGINRFGYSVESLDIKLPSANNVRANMICDRYATETADGTYLKRQGIAINASNKRIFVFDPLYNDVTDFMASFDHLYLCYELATPIEIQLTPTQVNSLLGVNNIWADSGDTEVEYRADTKLYIERLTAPDSADMIADANITSGQYFMVGNSLYKATANIANGGQIIVGTNCTRVSLAQALNEINA